MTIRFSSAVFVAVAAMLLGSVTLTSGRAAGLYGGGDKDLTTGELNSQDYWWTKFDMTMLDLAIKQRQPEGAISVSLASTSRRVDELLKTFPKHEEIKQWRAKIDDVNSKIDPNANRGASFTAECPWEQANYAQLWVNSHWAKAAAAQNDWSTVRSCLQNVMQNYEVMLKPDRMKQYPEDLRKWVIDSKPAAEKLYAQAKAKLGG